MEVFGYNAFCFFDEETAYEVRISAWSSDVCSSDLSCDSCGAVYAPTELINPYSTLTKATPVLKSSEHFFFKLSDPRCVEFLQAWTTGSNASGNKRLQSEVLAKTREWLGTGSDDGEANLADWDISRDERSEEHTSELQSLMRISYAVFRLTKKNNHNR